jgi:site-specific DNA-cytosine methylase
MRVLSLFDGCAGARQALDNLGINCTYYASEVDKYAIQIAMKNYPDIIQLGDITKLDESNLPKDIDLLVGGSPCQGFSFAGKQLNFNDPRSRLFFEFIRIFKETKPKYFVLENVKMKKEYQDVISEYLGVQPVVINSSLLTAQNRERLYWTNIPSVEQPVDRGLFLCDVISPGSGKYLTKETSSRPRTIRNIRRPDQKSFCLLATMYKLSQSNGMTVVDDNGLRCISPIECERLQGMKDNYTEGVSNTQRYKMIGNGFTIPVIEHILMGNETMMEFDL